MAKLTHHDYGVGLMTKIRMAVGDTEPALRVTLTWADGTVVTMDPLVDTVEFHMSRKGVNKVDAAATIVDGPNGIVEYEWVSADTDTSGIFDAEFTVFFGASQRPASFPADGKFEVIIRDSRGD